MSRVSSNCSVIDAVPKLLVEVIALSAAIWPKACSSGVVTEDARVSGLAPGRATLTWMVGKSTEGSAAIGSER